MSPSSILGTPTCQSRYKGEGNKAEEEGSLRRKAQSDRSDMNICESSSK